MIRFGKGLLDILETLFPVAMDGCVRANLRGQIDLHATGQNCCGLGRDPCQGFDRFIVQHVAFGQHLGRQADVKCLLPAASAIALCPSASRSAAIKPFK